MTVLEAGLGLLSTYTSESSVDGETEGQADDDLSLAVLDWKRRKAISEWELRLK